MDVTAVCQFIAQFVGFIVVSGFGLYLSLKMGALVVFSFMSQGFCNIRGWDLVGCIALMSAGVFLIYCGYCVSPFDLNLSIK